MEVEYTSEQEEEEDDSRVEFEWDADTVLTENELSKAWFSLWTPLLSRVIIFFRGYHRKEYNFDETVYLFKEFMSTRDVSLCYKIGKFVSHPLEKGTDLYNVVIYHAILNKLYKL